MHRIIVHAVIQGVAFPGVDTLAAPTVERDKACAKTVQLGGHIAGVEVHGKVDQSARFEQEQTVLRVAVLGILLDCHAVVLTCALAFQLKGRNGKAVEEHNKVDALVIVNPDFLHDGENVGIILGDKVNVVIGGWLTVQQVQMHIGNFNAGFQCFDKAAALVVDGLQNKLDDGFFCLSIIDFAQASHGIGLCRLQKAKQQFAVHGHGAVVIRFALALDIAVILNQIVNDITLIIALCSDVFQGLSLLAQAYNIHYLLLVLESAVSIFRDFSANNIDTIRKQCLTANPEKPQFSQNLFLTFRVYLNSGSNAGIILRNWTYHSFKCHTLTKTPNIIWEKNISALLYPLAQMSKWRINENWFTRNFPQPIIIIRFKFGVSIVVSVQQFEQILLFRKIIHVFRNAKETFG